LLRFERVRDALPPGLAALAAEAAAEDVGNVDRLIQEWQNGVQRFDHSGEILLVAFDGEALIAVGGVTTEPDTTIGETARRMRRLYVRPAARGRGVGRALVVALKTHAFRYCDLLTVNAGVPGAAPFWEALGFARVAAATRTHELRKTMSI
jgi:GNAT superfamily N-acetyltransferase